jgi:hypothetical protein
MKQFFLLCVFLSVFLSHAQLKTTFEKGWIFKDELKQIGYIRSDDLSMLSKRVCFKRSLEDQKCELYDTSQVSSFQVANGETFDLVHVEVDNHRKEIDLFAYLIFKGEKLSLYKSVRNAEPFYVLSKDGENYALQNNKLISGEMEIRKYNYEGVLNFVSEGLAFRNEKKITYDEDYFVDIVSKYNAFKNAKGSDVRVEKKVKNYIVFATGMGVRGDRSEYFGQIMYRKYVPKLSRKISMNFGISYFHYQFTEQNKDVQRSLFSMPLQFQHNFFDKNIRPYIFSGLSLTYLDTSERDKRSALQERFEQNYALNLLYGAGIEIEMFKKMYVKVEYRREAYSHPVLFGIGCVLESR